MRPRGFPEEVWNKRNTKENTLERLKLILTAQESSLESCRLAYDESLKGIAITRAKIQELIDN